MRTLIALLLAAAPAFAVTPREAAAAAREWRTKHEKEIVAELSALVAIPNLATDKVNIERNAAAIAEAFTRRGASVKLLRVEGAPPLVVATLGSAGVLAGWTGGVPRRRWGVWRRDAGAPRRLHVSAGLSVFRADRGDRPTDP